MQAGWRQEGLAVSSTVFFFKQLSVYFSSVGYALQHRVLRGCRPAGRDRFSIHAGTSCPLEMENGGKWSGGRLSQYDRSGNDETSFAEFRCCSRHDQISTFRRTETGSTREIRRRYADVLEICRTGASDAGECKECSFNPYSLRCR